MDKLLTKKELAERWQVAEKTIDNWRESGILTPCTGIPAIRFSLQHIAELEGTKLERFSPIEKKRLEIENEKLKQENEQLKRIISNVLSETSKIVNL
ncbi:histidine kinase [Clostridium botulinum]|uniref:Histidine kinase n=1 Tax=Clostridium botulinum TaxID=1491 RepID=A0AAU8Z1Q0_CLOBO|nr:histidine kinase [Clostridium sporogenes]AVP66185.1 histidine kinase [Clostridium botulinum]MCF4017074.1 histidine kinase [Clostridium sporogenes]